MVPTTMVSRVRDLVLVPAVARPRPQRVGGGPGEVLEVLVSQEVMVFLGPRPCWAAWETLVLVHGCGCGWRGRGCG